MNVSIAVVTVAGFYRYNQYEASFIIVISDF